MADGHPSGSKEETCEQQLRQPIYDTMSRPPTVYTKPSETLPVDRRSKGSCIYYQ